MNELLEKELCSLGPDYFDDSIKVLQKQPDSLKEMIEMAVIGYWSKSI